MLQCLQDNAVAFRELDQFVELFRWRIRVDVKSEIDAGESDGHRSINPQRATKVHDSVSLDFGSSDLQSHGCRHCGHGRSGAGDKSLQQHVAGTGCRSVAACHGMQAGDDLCAIMGWYRDSAGEICKIHDSHSVEFSDGGVGTGLIPLFEWCLESLECVAVHKFFSGENPDSSGIRQG